MKKSLLLLIFIRTSLFDFLFIRSKSLLILTCSLFMALHSYAATCSSTGSGDWSNVAIWSCGHVPACGDNVTIASGTTVTVDIQVDMTFGGTCSTAITLTINGTLSFSTGKKMTLPPGSSVVINSGGVLDPGAGGGSSNLITIGTTIVWSAAAGQISGPVTLSESAPLPIELVTFNAHVNGNKTEIVWTTATETNNDFFTIEKSKDAQSFTAVINADGAGTSTQLIDYFEIDHNPYAGVSYYRLKQTDFDGRISYSNIVPIEYSPDGESSILLFPNPAEENSPAYISLSNLEGQEILVVLRDITGNEVYSKVVITSSNNEIVAIDQEGKLAKGTYLVTAASVNKLYSKKLIVK